MSSDDSLGMQDERREYFRIDDTIQVKYRVVKADDIPEHFADESQDIIDSFTVMTRLQAITQSLTATLRRIQQKDPDVADYLKALDEKIDMLGQSFLSEETDMLVQPSHPVNLSAGGIAIDSNKSIEVGSVVEVKLLLLPSFTGVVAYGDVVGIGQPEESDGDYKYQIRINFTHMRAADQEALIRHIMRRQGELLRIRREKREQNELQGGNEKA